jgi:hypothetical protein
MRFLSLILKRKDNLFSGCKCVPLRSPPFCPTLSPEHVPDFLSINEAILPVTRCGFDAMRSNARKANRALAKARKYSKCFNNRSNTYFGIALILYHQADERKQI